MSNRAINAVFDYSKTRGSMRTLLISIADGVNPDTSAWRAKIETLQARMNLPDASGRRYVHRLLNKLLVLGELCIIEHPGHSNEYVIPIFEGELGYAPISCESDEHSCNGSHTPLDVSREQLKRDEIRAQRRRNPRSRVAPEPPHSPSEGETTDSSGQETTPGWSGDHSPVVQGPPPSGQGTTQYPSLTPPITPLDTHGGATDSFFEMSSAWLQIIGSLSISQERKDKLERRCRLERHAEDKRLYRLVCADSAALEFAGRMHDVLQAAIRSLRTTPRDATLEVVR